MYNSEKTLPIIISFSANDPTGSAGIQADIEAIGSMGCHCAPVITTITARDTADLYEFFPCPARVVQSQAKAILEDMSIAAFKVGILGSIDNIRIVHQVLKNYPNIPVVFNPTVQIGRKAKVLDPNLLEAMIALILPLAKVCTPNVHEARLMAPEADTLDACAQEIMTYGADFVLITGNLQTPNKVTNTLYGNYRRLETFQCERLANDYQGTGCTFSAVIAAMLAQGFPVASAILQAQKYTFECLKQAYQIGMGQRLPNRLFWARETTPEIYNFENKTQKK